MITYSWSGKSMRPIAILLTAILTMPLLTGGDKAIGAAIADQNGRTVYNISENLPNARPGLSNVQKIGITLVGAAALFYLYRQHQNKKGVGKEGQYYQSKNGGIYYRDQKGRPVYVKPPSQPIQVQVPQSEADQYSQYQGYNGRNTGRSLGAVGAQ